MLRFRGLSSNLRARLPGCALALLVCLPAYGALWPESFGGFTRVTSVAAAPTTDQALWDEYGLVATEKAEFTAAKGGKLTATAWRFKDSTGAFAAFHWREAPNARPSTLGKLAAEAGGDVWLAFGNYLFQFSGARPEPSDLQVLFGGLARLEQSPSPAFPTNLPLQDMVANSRRHIVGPVALERFYPQIPSALAGFRFGAEAHLARYRAAGGEMVMAVFSYPTPHIAREQERAFQKLAGAMVKRSGPLVAVIASPTNENAAEKLLSRVRYEAEISWNERVPTRRDNVGDLILNVFSLIGILLVFALVSGLAFGGLRATARRFLGWSPASEDVITLDLSDGK
jgi:hypothetical protein